MLAKANGLDFSRAAVAVSAAHGIAVRRNRLRRLCREAFRLSRSALPGGWDFVIMPRRGQYASLDQLRASIMSLGGRLTDGGATRKGRR